MPIDSPNNHYVIMIDINQIEAGQPSETPVQILQPSENKRGPARTHQTSHLVGDWCGKKIKMNGKPVIYRDAKTVLTINDDHGFRHKWLCDGITLNLGDACAFSCAYCYVGPAMLKVLHGLMDDYNAQHATSFGHSDFVVRRRQSLELLKNQLLVRGQPKYADPADNRTVFFSTLVDVAANKELLHETAGASLTILENTSWQIRFLSKSGLLSKLVSDGLIPDKYHHRLIFGFSTGTLDDRVARAVENGTSAVSKRLESLHWLQDNGFRTYAMICPSLPQTDYEKFSHDICQASRVDKCEEVWAEVINVRGESFARTLAALQKAGLEYEAAALSNVAGPKSSERWEQYVRKTFLAHTRHVPPDKLRFLHYPRKGTTEWWKPMMEKGALLLGSEAEEHNLITIRDQHGVEAKVVEAAVLASASEDSSSGNDVKEFTRLHKVVSKGFAAFMEAGMALREIHDRELWKAGGFKTWEAYCRETAGSSRSYVHRLMSAAQLAEELSSTLPNGDATRGILPRNESQVRPLSKLSDAAQRQEAWSLAVSKANGSQPTAKIVTTAVAELSPAKTRTQLSSLKERRLVLLSAMKVIVERRDSWDEVASLLQQLEEIG